MKYCYGTVTYSLMDSSKSYINREPTTLVGRSVVVRLDRDEIFDGQVSLAYAITFLCILLLQYILKLIPCSGLSFRGPKLGAHQIQSGYFHISNWFTVKSKLSKFEQIWAKNMKIIRKKLNIVFALNCCRTRLSQNLYNILGNSCLRQVYHVTKFKSLQIFAVVCIIIEVGGVVFCVLLHFVWDLEATEMNVQRSLFRKYLMRIWRIKQ